MKTLEHFISEVLVKNNLKNANVHRYFIIDASGVDFDKLEEDYSDAMIGTAQASSIIFVLPTKELENITSEYMQDRWTKIYYFPDEYDLDDDFEEAWENGEIDIEDLEEINLD